MRKTLDEGLYLVYTFQVQKDKSKFLGLNGTKLDIIVRLTLLVLSNQKHLSYCCVKRNNFLMNRVFRSYWNGEKGEVAGGCRKGTPFVRMTPPTVFIIRSFFVLQIKYTYIRHVLISWILKFNNLCNKYKLLELVIFLQLMGTPFCTDNSNYSF